MIYIGIDVAKFSHVASVINSDGKVLIEPFSFNNSNEGFNFFISKISSFNVEDCLIGLEATGHYSDNLVYFLFEKNFKIGIINPIQTDALRSSNIRKTKNDKIDTFLISQCLMIGKYTTFTPKDADVLKLKILSRFRNNIVRSKSKLKVQLVACIDSVFPELYNFFNGNLHSKTCYEILSKFTYPKIISKTRVDCIANTLASASRGKYSYDDALRLKSLASKSIGIFNPASKIQILSLIEQINLLESQITMIDSEIKEIMDILDSKILTIPGIGYTLGAAILGELGDISRFSSPKKILAYAGLDPDVRQSGCFCATNTKISKRGSKLLRYAITYASTVIIHNNDTFYKYYTSKRSEGKAYRNAIGHVSGKLVRVIFKILTENVEFKLP